MSGLHSLLSDSDSEDDPGVWLSASAASDGRAVGELPRMHVQQPGAVTTRANPELHLKWGPVPAPGRGAASGFGVIQWRPGSPPVSRMHPTHPGADPGRQRPASSREFQMGPHRATGSRHASETPPEQDGQVIRPMLLTSLRGIPCASSAMTFAGNSILTTRGFCAVAEGGSGHQRGGSQLRDTAKAGGRGTRAGAQRGSGGDVRTQFRERAPQPHFATCATTCV